MSEENTNENNPQSSNASSDNTSQTTTSNQAGSEFKPWGMEEKTFCMLMHFSQFLSFCTGFGLYAPIIMWLTNKDKSEFLDSHGKTVTNFLISMTIWLIISSILTFVLIGFLTFLVIGLIMLICPIIAGIKANQGKNYKYPLTISFFK